MVAEVVAAIAAAEEVERVLVVSGEAAMVEIACAAGAELVPDHEDRGHSEAALLGIEVALAAGADCVALLPGDCPLLDPGELDASLRNVTPGSVCVIPDRHGSGTNGLLLSPPDAIAPAFGPDSRERHLRSGAEAGWEAKVLEVPSLALDLDDGGDLAELRRRVGTGPGVGRLGAALDDLEQSPVERPS
jgi:2-phospho-L-lactate guanylyltransferase